MLAFTFTGCISSHKISTNEPEAYIRFGSGYHADTISLKLNTTHVLKNEIITTLEDNSGITGSYLSIYKYSILYFKDGKLKFTVLLESHYDDKIVIEQSINNRPYSYTMYFKKGKYLFISKHWYFYNVYFDQYKKTPELY